ncbi:ATP-binding protein [Paraburkholderia nodosa]|uniref:ATP-binding protein n=1 Tax=Paraburkholderia nodosa TaxID=392320 RepID=UPI0004BBDCF9|nr:ATP-binding protein [Paraburkholderia nodosa]
MDMHDEARAHRAPIERLMACMSAKRARRRKLAREGALADARESPSPAGGFGAALLACGATTLAANELLRVFAASNVVMLFLFVVVLLSLRYGRLVGAWSALLSVGSFDFFFVDPRFSFAVSDTQYLFTFTLILVVALVTGQLGAGLREKAQVATAGERRATALARVARELSGAISAEEVAHVCAQTLALLVQVRVALVVASERGTLRTIGEADFVDDSIAHWSFAHLQPAGAGTAALPGARALYLPLRGPIATRGVIALVGSDGAPLADASARGLLEACCSLIALALERCHFIEIAQSAQLRVEGERLRNALLAAVSHDLKTPLTAIGGLAETLERADALPDEERRVVSRAIRLQTEGLHRLVTNLLDLARMQGEGVRLNKEWHALDEIVGSAFARLGTSLDAHRTRTDLAAGLPLIELDAIAFERVLVNLIDNAVKYTPPGSTVTVRAHAVGDRVHVVVEDDGPGLPRIESERLFEAFARGVKESSITGVGLGLALCRTIVEAHGGAIECENREPRGARFTISLPMRTPPDFLEEPTA